MIRKLAVCCLVAALALAGCGSRDARRTADGAAVDPAPSGFVHDRQQVIAAIQRQMDAIAPERAPRGLKWHVTRIALLAPHFALVGYSEGHIARMALFRVEAAGDGPRFTPVLHGEYNPAAPVEWDWTAGASGG